MESKAVAVPGSPTAVDRYASLTTPREIGRAKAEFFTQENIQAVFQPMLDLVERPAIEARDGQRFLTGLVDFLKNWAALLETAQQLQAAEARVDPDKKAKLDNLYSWLKSSFGRKVLNITVSHPDAGQLHFYHIVAAFNTIYAEPIKTLNIVLIDTFGSHTTEAAAIPTSSPNRKRALNSMNPRERSDLPDRIATRPQGIWAVHKQLLDDAISGGFTRYAATLRPCSFQISEDQALRIYHSLVEYFSARALTPQKEESARRRLEEDTLRHSPRHRVSHHDKTMRAARCQTALAITALLGFSAGLTTLEHLVLMKKQYQNLTNKIGGDGTVAIFFAANLVALILVAALGYYAYRERPARCRRGRHPVFSLGSGTAASSPLVDKEERQNYGGTDVYDGPPGAGPYTPPNAGGAAPPRTPPRR